LKIACKASLHGAGISWLLIVNRPFCLSSNKNVFSFMVIPGFAKFGVVDVK